MALLTLQGANAFAAATVSPTSLSWNYVAIGNTGGQKVVTLTNSNSAAITISSIAISGTNAGDFRIFSKTCSTSLAAGASCTANIVFAPTATGTRTATLSFTDSDSTSPQKVSLTGLGSSASGSVSASPTSLSFGSVNVGSTSAGQTVTLTNGTSSSVTISGVNLTGTNAGDFTISSKTCSTSLAAGAKCTATVAFKPTATGTRSATLSFADSATNSPQNVALSGTGASTSGGSVTAAPSSLSFTNVAVGSTSAAQNATLTNGTQASITISSVAIGGTNAGDFALASNGCGSSLAAGANCTASVVFKPTVSGTRTATLSFTDSGTGSPQTVALTGSGPSSTGAFEIQPQNPTVIVNDALQFSATVDVTWTASCGTISSTSGVYDAPATTGTCTVTATQTSGTHPTVSTSVKVTSGPSSGTLAVYPTSAAVYVGATQVFQAQLSGVPDGHSLLYTIDGVAGGNATTGTITNEGVYTAPTVAGTHHLTVKDNSLGTTATSTITVFSNVAVDFGSRTSTGLHQIKPHLFGAERLDSMHNTTDLNMVKAAGINYARFYALIPTVFATKTPNWAAIDANVSKISAGGVKIILQIFQTPPWLQPSGSPCGTGQPSLNALPTDLNAWGAMAAQYVKHMDQTFPGVVTDYEIWNEPNTAALCLPSSSRLTAYMNLYKAAAPQMRAQAAADFPTDPTKRPRVGGPATAGFQSSWVTPMLADSTISQNIDFMSYHHYMFSNTQLGAQWNTYNGTISVYQRTQNTGAGPMSTYAYAAKIVAGGKQPQGANLPIYNTEYNLNWAYSKECCRNDPTYSPVWNGMYVADMLNAVYNGAPNEIEHLVYFAATAHPYFCLVGQINTNMDCYYPSGSTPQAYPQYYLYQMFGSPSYLGLQNGGWMAKSISPGTLGNGLVTTAFYTSNLDAIVLVNPSADTLSNVKVTANNTGLASASATVYHIVDGASIQNYSVPLQLTGGTSYTTTITLEPYSVQAISIHQ